MIRIESYLRADDGSFTAIADVEQWSGDPDYVEGAIELDIDGARILDQELWDDINWLWPFLCNMAEELVDTGRGYTSFPDQPIELTFVDRGDGMVVVTCSMSGERPRSGVVERTELLDALSTAATAFFGHLKRLSPAGPTYDEALARLERARRAAA